MCIKDKFKKQLEKEARDAAFGDIKPIHRSAIEPDTAFIEAKEILTEFIINSNDKEMKTKLLKVYDYINRPRPYVLSIPGAHTTFD